MTILLQSKFNFEAHAKRIRFKCFFKKKKLFYRYNHENLTTLVTFVDFKAAYDLVSRDILIQKLIGMNIDRSIISTICNFLCQRFISVRYNDFTTSYKQVKRGLPQGAVSSTTLLNCFLNDLCLQLKLTPGVEIILYADVGVE